MEGFQAGAVFIVITLLFIGLVICGICGINAMIDVNRVHLNTTSNLEGLTSVEITVDENVDVIINRIYSQESIDSMRNDK